MGWCLKEDQDPRPQAWWARTGLGSCSPGDLGCLYLSLQVDMGDWVFEGSRVSL